MVAPEPQPGPEWMLWAGKLRILHDELCKQIERNAHATTQNSGTIARNEEQLQDFNVRHEDLRVSHSQLHDETRSFLEDVRRLTQKVDEIQRFCDLKHQSFHRRVTKVEQLQEGLLKRIDDCQSQIKAAVERQTQASPERKQQRTHNLTELNQPLNRQNALEKEVDQMRKEIRALLSAIQSEGKLQGNVSGKCYPNVSTDPPQAVANDASAIKSTHRTTLVSRRSYMSHALDVPHEPRVLRSHVHRDAGSLLTHGSCEETLSNESSVDESVNERLQAFRLSEADAELIRGQGFMDVDEYWLLREDTIKSRLRAFEKRMLKQFVSGLRLPEDRAKITEKLDKYGWTCASLEPEIEALRQKENKRQEFQAQARLNTADSTSSDEL